jgi:Domain of Unknown Function (DUF1206)
VTVSADQVEQSLRTSTGFDRIVRSGLVVYALLHLLIAALSFQLALTGQRVTSQGALAQLAQNSWGVPVIVALSAGFVALSLWQLLAALVGYRELENRRRTVMRLGAACRVVTYAYLAYATFDVVALRSSRSGSGTSPQSASARLLAEPLGQVLLAVTGVIIAGIGLGLVVFGLRGEFRAQLDRDAASDRRWYPIVVLGYVGYCAKGAAFVVVGLLACWAGVTDNPRQTGGLDRSLERLMGESWGTAAVALFGVGLGCFGLYLLARARHLRRRTLTA